MEKSLKFQDFKYKRPDVERLGNKLDSLIEEFKNAKDTKEQYDIILSINNIRNEFSTMRTISSIRNTVNTVDEFYSEEKKYFDNNGPVFRSYVIKFYKALTGSVHRNELMKLTGEELFSIADLSMKTFKPEIIEDLKVENRLVTEYVKLIASAKITFDNKELNLAGISPYTLSEDRDVRKAANEAKWKFYEDNEKEIGRIYDELVKLRSGIAKKLGYENFTQLAYDRMGRTDYTYKEVQSFRDSVKEYLVPLSVKLDDMKRERVGLDKLYYYDSGLSFRDGNPTPKGSPEWITEKAKKMYEELSPETGKFINQMVEQSLMDLYNRKDKSAGGYCTFIPDHDSPFIFANMNGTSDDVRVLTHEAGHAFQVNESSHFEIIEYINPTLDACEIHSMSMEFLTWPWMNLFFEGDTDKFLFSHLCRALKFIPYGVTVDEFQHYVYDNPEATMEERKSMWNKIERKYDPELDYAGNEFLEKGGYWFMQGHIFKRPFYYIDYCLAEICALQFWKKANHDRNAAWEDYLRLCKAGGSKSFLKLLEVAGLESPFDEKVVKSIVEYCYEWTERVNKEFELSIEY